MHLLLTHNYSVKQCTWGSSEHVAVRTKTGKAHIRFAGFIEIDRGRALVESGEANWVKVDCNGWRRSFYEDWMHLAKGEYLVGVHVNGGLYVVLDGDALLIKLD